MLFSDKFNSSRKGWCFRKMFFSRILTSVILLLPLMFLISCGDSASERADQVGGLTAKQVIENPSAYVGKTVTVSGEVEEIHGSRAFSMDSGLSVGELLVVGREAYPQVAEAGNRAYVVSDVATVTGVVRMMVAAEIERELGWDLTPEIEAEYNAKPILVAQTVSFRTGSGKTQTAPANNNSQQSAANTNEVQSAANANGSQSNLGQTESSNRITDVGAYAATGDKLSLVNREAQFSNARVVRVVGPRTFTIASGNDELYVMLDDESARGVGTQGKIAVGSTLNVNGRFERLTEEEISDVAGNRFRELTDQERAFMKKTKVFLQANKVSDLK